MKDRKLIGLGVVGTIIAALCCFTPLLVVGAAVVGLSAIVGWLDFVLFPALFFFIGLTAYPVHRRRSNLTKMSVGDERCALPEQGRS